jgi:hypothetical protein
MTAFRNIALCSLVEVDRGLRGSTHPYMVLYPRRLSSSYLSPQEPEIPQKSSKIYVLQFLGVNYFRNRIANWSAALRAIIVNA